MSLVDFIRESNRIEGIEREPLEREIDAHASLITLRRLSREAVEGFVQVVAGAPLRDKPGMDVRIGNHRPAAGSPEIAYRLKSLLDGVNTLKAFTPYEAHVFYERLHPFMDGNGRSGRAVWAWQMYHEGHDPFALPFLHRFYYQALDASGPSEGGKD